MSVLRVFPRKTKATPDDDLVFVGDPPNDLFFTMPEEVKEIHVSVAFSWDKVRAEQMAENWRTFGLPVKIGGPAYGQRSGEFVPGRYLKEGWTFTSRGCPNHCWFCRVWRDCGGLQELEIQDGWIIADDNVLATSRDHFTAVCEMLKHQPHSARFVGGLEAKILTDWHVEKLREVNPAVMYFAYDTPDDLEPLIEAGKKLIAGGFRLQSQRMKCYVLIGFKGDTFVKATKRLEQTMDAGFVPYAMLYRDEKGDMDREWRQFQREWCNPIIAGLKFGEHLARKGKT